MDLANEDHRVRKTRVLLVLHELSLSGAPSTALEIFERLRNETKVFTLALRDGPQQGRATELGRVIALTNPADNFRRRQLRRFGRLAASALIAAWRPDVIYVNSILGLEVARLVYLPSRPLILHVHEIGGVLRRHAAIHKDRFVKLPARYFAPTEKVAAQLRDECALAEAKVRVVRPFLSAVSSDSTAEPLESRARFIVGGAGGPLWAKGLVLWLEVAAELRQLLGPDKVEFVWVGVRDDEESAQFRQMANKMALTDVVTFVEETPDWLEHFKRFDAFAMTSWEESASRVTLYSMMLAKPVLCFAGSGGPEELLGEAGIVIPSFSARLMGEALAELANCPDRRATLGRKGRERVQQNHVAATELEKIRKELAALAAVT